MQILNFGERVRGGKPSTNEKLRTPALAPGASVNEWTMCKWEWFRQAQPNGFGVGGLVPAAGCGFWRACPWGKAVHEWKPRTFGEWIMCKWESLRGGGGCPLRQVQRKALRGLCQRGKSCAKLLAHCATFARAPTILLRSSM